MHAQAPIVARSRCPGKVILAGEHAVVYGCPALVMAVDRYATCTVTYREEPTADPRVRFHLPDLDSELDLSVTELLNLRDGLSDRLTAFRDGELPFAQVLPDKPQMVPFAFGLLAEPDRLQCDLDVHLAIDIPIGCGMGSSAAVGLAVLFAAAATFRHELTGNELLAHSLTCESLLHGAPSGVDSAVCQLGGCRRFEQGELQDLPLPSFPLWFVNTGTPETSTGAAVMQVRERFQDDFIWMRFHSIVGRLEACLRAGDATHFQQALRLNHRLLTTIGVVPDRVQQFIRDVEGLDAAAKICGAGAIAGDAGGIVMIAANGPPTRLIEDYGYHLLTLEADPDGAQLLD